MSGQDSRSRSIDSGGPGRPAEPVRIVAVDIPFGDMVALLVKLALAAIPAAVILASFAAMAIVVVGMFVRGLH